MANMFEKYAADREAEQKKIEKTVSTDVAPVEDEKRTTLCLGRSLTEAHFTGWAESMVAPYTVEGLISRITALHRRYHSLAHHGIASDIEFICKVNALCVTSVINITYESARVPARAMA